MFADLKDGYQTVMQKRSLWFTILFGSAGFFAIFLHDTLIGPATKQMGFDQSILGLSITAVGAGGAIGALLVGMIKKQPHPYMLMASGMMVASGFTVLLGYALYTAVERAHVAVFDRVLYRWRGKRGDLYPDAHDLPVGDATRKNGAGNSA